MLRLKIIKAAVVCLFFFLVIGLFKVQIMDGSYFRALSESNRIRLLPIEAPRGRIFDRTGALLAGNRPSFTVRVIPEDIDDKTVAELALLLGLTEEELRNRIKKADRYLLGPVTVARDIDRLVMFKLEEKSPELKGVMVQLEGVRYYPDEKVVSHVVGYIGKVSREELRNASEGTYSYHDWIGRAGVELTYDKLLRGENGGKQLEVDAQGHVMRTLSERSAELGSDLTLTIDVKLQEAAWEVMKPVKRGVCAIMDIKTGEILAFISKPSYDSNSFVMPSGSKERLELLKDRSFPMMDRNVSAAYPPGSVFKLVTATAALETGKATPNTTFNCSGSYRINARSRAFKCWKSGGHGTVNLSQAIEQSCNVYFYQLGKRVGVKDIAKYARLFGFGKTSSIGLPNLKGGVVPDEEWKRERFKEKWYQGETLNYAIGQGFLLVTPAQVLQMVGLIVNDGKMPAAHIVKGKKVDLVSMPIKPSTCRFLKQAMRLVVQSDKGTGHYARAPFFEIAAKTGTAQVPGKKPHAWFAGFFPYKNPKVAMVVLIENGGPGGIVAARYAKKIAAEWRKLYAA